MSKKIGILQVDGKLPNLALLQIAQFFINKGKRVEPYQADEKYNKVFASRIFNFSKMMEEKYYETPWHLQRAKHIQRWVNSRAAFKKCTFEEYCKQKKFNLEGP